MGIPVFILGFIFGILVSSFLKISLLSGAMFVCAGVLICIAQKYIGKVFGEETGEIRRKIFFSCLACAAFGLGCMRYEVKDFHAHDPQFEQGIGQSVDLKGIVFDEPDIRDTDNRFVLEIVAPSTRQKEKILVSTSLFSGIEYGDEVEVNGKLKVPGVIRADPKDPTNGPGQGNDFDYAAYLAREDIYYTMSFAHVQIISRGHGSEIISALYSFKRTFERRIEKTFAEPDASLLEGLLVAGKQALPTRVLDDFINAGVVHIVVLSGYNISIVAEFLLSIFSFLALRLALGASAAGILLFVLMAGATPSIVRAAAMGLIALGGRAIGRTYSVSRALLAAAFFMLIQNPKILVFDPSFQLSFLATVAMVWVSPVFERHLPKMPFVPRSLGEVGEKLHVRSLVSVTLGTQAFVLPYLLYQMGQVSVVSPVSNILILPLVPITMLAGFIAAILSFVSPIIAMPVSYPTHLLLDWILSVAHALGGVGFASLSISRFPLWTVLVSYGGFISLLLWEKKKAPS